MQVDYLLFFGIIAVQDFTIVEEGLERSRECIQHLNSTSLLNTIKFRSMGLNIPGMWHRIIIGAQKSVSIWDLLGAGLRIKTYARLVRSNFSRYIDMYDYMDASSNYWKKGSKSSTC